jgi:hypothetical protein
MSVSSNPTTTLPRRGAQRVGGSEENSGTGDVIAFGGRHLVTGRVRKSGSQAEAPDWYPIQMGIVQVLKQRDAVNQHQLSIISGLREALKARSVRANSGG